MTSEIFDTYINEELNELVISCNFKNLIEDRKKVIKKYSIHNELPYQMINRFIPQIVEEIFEYQVELEKENKFSMEAKLELIDIILYHGSVMAEYAYRFDCESLFDSKNLYRKRMLYDSEVAYSILHTEINLEKEQLIQINNDHTISRIVQNLGKIRNHYPQRKYHKELPYHKFLNSLMLDKNFNLEQLELLQDSIFHCIHMYIFNEHVRSEKTIFTDRDIKETILELNNLLTEKINYNDTVSDK